MHARCKALREYGRAGSGYIAFERSASPFVAGWYRAEAICLIPFFNKGDFELCTNKTGAITSN